MPASPSPVHDGSVGEVVLAYLAEQRGRMVHAGADVRGGGAEGVHDLRVASRRLRSALTAWSGLFRPGATKAVRRELRWVSDVLAAARDAEVLRARVLASPLLHDEAGGPTEVARLLDRELSRSADAARDAAVVALGGRRYAAVGGLVDAFVAAPPFTEGASESARQALPRRVALDRRRLAKLVPPVGGSGDRDAALHEARKAAKRLRYSAELASATFPKPAAEVAAAAREVQDLLGQQHDAVVARQALRELAAASGDDPEVVAVVRRLAKGERRRARASATEFERAWRRFPSVDPKAWRKPT